MTLYMEPAIFHSSTHTIVLFTVSQWKYIHKKKRKRKKEIKNKKGCEDQAGKSVSSIGTGLTKCNKTGMNLTTTGSTGGGAVLLSNHTK